MHVDGGSFDDSRRLTHRDLFEPFISELVNHLIENPGFSLQGGIHGTVFPDHSVAICVQAFGYYRKHSLMERHVHLFRI